MASAHVRNGWWTIDFTWNSRRETGIPLGLKADHRRHETIARNRARELTSLLGMGQHRVDLVEFFPKAKALHRRLGLKPRGVTTLGSYTLQLLKNWPAKHGKLTPATLHDYEQMVKGFVLKHRVASLPIAEVRYDDLLNFQAHLQTVTGGRRSNMVITVLKSVFKAAARNRDIPPGDNPALGIQAIRLAKPKINPFSEDQVGMLLDRAQGWVKALLTVLLHRGLRPNECLALSWRHVDFDKGTMEIAGTVHPKKFGGIGLPKTPAGERTIKMGHAIALALREQRLRVPRGDNDLVFPNENAQPHDLSNIRVRIWKPLLAECGIAYRTIYQCRHSYASISMAHNVAPILIGKVLGHTDASQVLKTYANSSGVGLEATGVAGVALDDVIKAATAARLQAAAS